MGIAWVATARRPDELIERFGVRDDLLAVQLDVTDGGQADAAVSAASAEFGGLDVLVNSAGASFKGYFEEMSPGQVDRQLAVNLVGPMNVTRAVLPVMRRQRSGLRDRDLIGRRLDRLRLLVGVRRVEGRSGGVDGRTR